MKIPYQPFPVGATPLIPSGVIHEPRVPLYLLGPSGLASYSALLDTGAAHCIVPASEAAALGIDLADAEQIETAGFTGDSLTLSLAPVDFRISHGGQSFQWPAFVGFAPFANPEDEIVLLGHLGCLDYFRTTFDGDAREVELVPTEAFPGTVN